MRVTTSGAGMCKTLKGLLGGFAVADCLLGIDVLQLIQRERDARDEPVRFNKRLRMFPEHCGHICRMPDEPFSVGRKQEAGLLNWRQLSDADQHVLQNTPARLVI